MQVRLYPHKQKFYKSVTSIISLVGGIPEELNRWSVKLGVQAVLEAPEGLEEKQYLEIAEEARLSVLRDAQVKGRAVHSWIEHHLGDTTPDIDPEYEPYYRAFLRFKQEHEISPIMLERTVVNEDFGYAGQFDFYGIVDGEPTLLDFKTSKSLHESYGYQLAAYREVLERAGHPVHKTQILHLRDTGRYTLKEYNVSFGHFVPWITVAEDMCRTLRVQYTTATTENALVAEAIAQKKTPAEAGVTEIQISSVEGLGTVSELPGRQFRPEELEISSRDVEQSHTPSLRTPRTCSGQEDTAPPQKGIEESPVEPQTRTTRRGRPPGSRNRKTLERIAGIPLPVPTLSDPDLELERAAVLAATRRTSPAIYESR